MDICVAQMKGWKGLQEMDEETKGGFLSWRLWETWPLLAELYGELWWLYGEISTSDIKGLFQELFSCFTY